MNSRLKTHSITKERVSVLLEVVLREYENRNVPISDITKQHLKEEIRNIETYDDLRFSIGRLKRIDAMARRIAEVLYNKITYFCGQWKSTSLT